MKKFDIEVGDFVKHPNFGNGNIWFEVSFASPDECHIRSVITHSIKTADITAHKTADITAHTKGKYIPEVGDWVCFKFVQGWFQVKEIRNGLIYTVTGQCYNMTDVWEHKRVTPISDTEFNDLAVGDEVEVAPEWYIRSQCDSQMRYKNVSQTLDCCGVKAVITGKYWSDDVSVNNKMSEIPLPGVGGDCVLRSGKDVLYDAYFKYNIKKENIMLDTVEEIGKLDKPNLEEAAKQVKASRDNDEVKAAKEKLNALLDNESRLKAQKERTDKDLAEVQELIKAFGYPPKESK